MNDQWTEDRETIKTWEDVQAKYETYKKRPEREGHWIFRGQELNKTLQTKLEKAFRDYGVGGNKKRQYEIETVREFQRKASLYLKSEPDKDDILGWLAVMQHYGAPTRLMDWTYSFYVGLYFALAERNSGALWAFNAAVANKSKPLVNMLRKSCGDEYRRMLRKLGRKDDVLGIRSKGDKLNDLIIVSCVMKAEKRMPLVYAVNPFRLNKRLMIQQGVFLFHGDIRRSFMGNLKEYCNRENIELKKNLHKTPLRPTRDERKEILYQLKSMNISNEALFPDLGGFAKYLWERLAYPETFPSEYAGTQ